MTQPAPPGAPSPQSRDGLASVILIDRRDDLAAICGRVDTAPTYAVVVHAPDGNRQLSTQLGMRRLIRHAEETGRIIAIATASRGVAGRARQANVAVARAPELVRWDSGGRRVFRLGAFSLLFPSVGHYIKLIALAALLAAAVVALFTVLPTADVSVVPPVSMLDEKLTLVAVPGRDSIDYETLKVPASEVTSTHRLTLAAKTTGKVQVGTRKARALVAMANTSAADVVVPLGAVVLAAPDNQPFVIDQETTVPAGKTAIQQVSAVNVGTKGNVAAGALTKFEDARFTSLRVSNAQPATGGTVEERPGVAATDLAALTLLAKDLEKSDAVKRLILAGRTGDAVVLRTARVAATPGTLTPPVGGEGDLVLLEVNVVVSALAIKGGTLEQLAVRRFSGRATGGGILVPGTVSAIETGAKQKDEDETYAGEFTIAAGFTKGLTVDAIRSAVRGKSGAAARSALRERFAVEDANIDLTPGWAPWLPRFDFRIDVALRAATPVPSPSLTPAPTNASTTPSTRTAAPAASATPAATTRP